MRLHDPSYIYIMSKLLRFLKNWTLPVAIVAGAVSYLVYVRLPLFNPLRPYAASIVAVVQPLFLFRRPYRQ